MCLDSAVKTYKKPLKEKRIGYKVKDLFNYNNEDYKYRNSDSYDCKEHDSNGKEYEPGFHILISKKAAIKLARKINEDYNKYSWHVTYCIYKVEYNDIVAEGYETCDNIVKYVPGRCKCDVARRMKILEKIEVR